MFYLAFAVGNLSQVVGSALEMEDEQAIRRVGTRLAAGKQQLDSWARRASARQIADLGAAGIYEINPQHDEALGLASLVEQLSDYLGSLQISFGVGMTCSEAWQAVQQAATAGESYRLFSPEAEVADEDTDDIEAELGLAKSEEPRPDSAEPDIRSKVRAALQGIKEQAAQIEALRSQAPDAYAAIHEVVMAMVAMAGQLASVEKSEVLYKALGLKLRYPPAEANPGSDSGAVNLGKKKKSVATDPITGLPLKQKWHSVRSGKVVGLKGGVVPSRQPNQD